MKLTCWVNLGSVVYRSSKTLNLFQPCGLLDESMGIILARFYRKLLLGKDVDTSTTHFYYYCSLLTKIVDHFLIDGRKFALSWPTLILKIESYWAGTAKQLGGVLSGVKNWKFCRVIIVVFRVIQMYTIPTVPSIYKILEVVWATSTDVHDLWNVSILVH